ncbi:MAG TPA: hypothetical protein VIT91_05890, partial [Chthoniobacterales bacterium]
MKAKYGLLVLFSCSLIYPEGSSRSEILENKGTWVVDWSSLEEIPHSTTNLEVNGIVYGKKALPYTLRVDLHNWKPDKQTAQAESNIFGKDRRGKGGTNFELANIVLTVSDQRMAV